MVRPRRDIPDRRPFLAARRDIGELSRQIEGLGNDLGEPLADGAGRSATFTIEAGTLLVCRAIDMLTEQFPRGIGGYALVETILEEREDGSSDVTHESFDLPLGKRATLSTLSGVFNGDGEQIPYVHPDLIKPKGVSPTLWRRQKAARAADIDRFVADMATGLYEGDFKRLKGLVDQAGAHNLSVQSFDTIIDSADS